MTFTLLSVCKIELQKQKQNENHLSSFLMKDKIEWLFVVLFGSLNLFETLVAALLIASKLTQENQNNEKETNEETWISFLMDQNSPLWYRLLD